MKQLLAFCRELKPRQYFLLGLILLVLFSLVIFSFNLTKPFNLDEADPIALAAHTILSDHKTFLQTPKLGLNHFPLYTYTLAAAFKLFDENTVTARGLGLLFFILTFIFILLICKELFVGRQFYAISFIAGGLYLINPLLIQYSLLIDMDGGMLTLCLVAFSYFFIRFNKQDINGRHVFILGSIFAVSLLTKFTTTPLLIPAMFLFYILQRKYKQAFLYPFLITLIGIALAWSIWYFYCRIFGAPLLYPINNNLRRLNQGGWLLTQARIMQIKYSLLYFIFWVSPAFAALMILSVVKRTTILVKQKTINRIDFLMILGVLIWLFYFYFAPRTAMMKYQIPLYPFFIIVISWFLFEMLIKDNPIKNIQIILVLGAIAWVYYFFCFPDMILWLVRGKSITSEFFRNYHYLFASLYFAPFVVLPFIFFFFYRRKDFFFIIILSFFLLTVAIQVSQDIKQAGDYTTANSWDNYGEVGQAQAIAYLNRHLAADGVAIVRKDIGYYLKTNPQGSAERKWIYNALFRSSAPEARLKFRKLMEEFDIEYVQLDSTCSIKRGYAVIKSDFTFEKRFGDFIIFKRRTM